MWKYCYRWTIPFVAILFISGCESIEPELQTPLEQVDYEKWTTHSRVVEFVETLENASPLMSMHYMGESEEGREIPYMKITSDDEFGSDDDKLTVLIYGQQHGNEPSGNDAILEILRDMVNGENTGWLDYMDILFVPQVNPDGAEVHQRRNAENVDLNRSHLILDGKEVRHLRELFHEWEPEVALDVHQYQPWVSSWMDYGYIRLFDEQYGLPTNLNTPEPIRELAEEEFLGYIDDHITEDGFTFHNYLIGNPESIRYSTSNVNDGRQGMAILSTFSLILEGRRDREDDGNIEHRTKGQISAIEGLLEFTVDYQEDITRSVRDSRQKLIDGEVDEFILTMGREQTGEPLTIPVLEVHENEDGDYEKGDTITVDIEEYYPLVVPERTTTMPEGYLIPSDEEEIIALLKSHRVDYEELDQGERIEVEQFRIDGFTEEEFESPTMIPTGSLQSGEYVSRQGDLYVPTAQMRGLMIATALEAQSMHGYIQYDQFEHLKQPGDFPILRVTSR